MPRRPISFFARILAALAFTGATGFSQQKEPERVPIKPEIVGRLTENSYLTPTNQILTPVGVQVGMPGARPQALAISPDGTMLITTGKDGEIIVIDPVSG